MNKLFALVQMIFVSSLSYGEVTGIDKKLSANTNPTTLCSADIHGNAVTVVVFPSEAECNSYVNSIVIGAPVGYTYSNCSAASYCMTYSTPLAGSLVGFTTVSIAAQGFSDAALGLPTVEDCYALGNATTIYCGNGGKVGCHGSTLEFSNCGPGFGGGTFSLPANNISTFNFLPD